MRPARGLKHALLAILWFSLTACAPATDAPTIIDEPTKAAPTQQADAPSTTSFGEVVSGRTDEGVYFYGSPDAPVTLIDYSDFL